MFATPIKQIGYVLSVTLQVMSMGLLHADEADRQASSNEILEVGEYELLYSSEYINDHCIVYDSVDHKWHMYGIHSGQRSFIHLTSDSLTAAPWKREADFSYNGREIWAPHVIRHDSKYWMYFTAIGDPRQIVLSTTKDLDGGQWSPHPSNPILAHQSDDGINGKNKDCMLLRDHNQWVIYYSMVAKQTAGEDYWVVGYSTSNDLLTWSEPQIAFDENPPEDPGVESPFVVRRGKFYYLFLSARPWPYGGVDVFRSESPYHWDPERDFIKRFPGEPTKAHAMEVIQDIDGNWYITRCGPDAGGWWMAPLAWNDGQESVETNAGKAILSDGNSPLDKR